MKPSTKKVKALSYRGLQPASKKASAAARGSSNKSGNKPERLLRYELWKSGYRYRKNVSQILGNPDILFISSRVAIFCDGDFWHGKDWKSRRRKLMHGHNPDYWVAKIERNIERDIHISHQLENKGWHVIRVWESEIKNDVNKVVKRISKALNDSH